MKEQYTIQNMKKIRWGVLEENQPISLFPVMYPGWCGIIEQTGKILGKPQKNIINLNRGNNGIIFVDHKEWTALGEFALAKILKKPDWGLDLNKKILKYSDELTTFSGKIHKANLRKKTNLELYQLYKIYLDKHSNLYNHSIVPVYLDLYKPHLTSYMVEYLTYKARKAGFLKGGKEVFALLTIPNELSKVQEEERSLLKVALNRKNIKKHIQEFKYLGYNFEGPVFPDNYFLKRVKDALKDKISPKAKIALIEEEKAQAEKIHNELIKNLRIDKNHKQLLELTKGFIYSKDYRKMSLVQSYYEIEPLLKELARRFNLTLGEFRNCLLVEVEQMALGKIEKPADLAARTRGCLFAVIDGNLPGRVFVDARFRQMRHYLLQKEDLTEVNYFHGQTACIGKARGRVKIVNSTADLKKMKKGDILVSQMTNPDLVPAMKLAGAIVTDLGGITSHAAIVSRELKKPCVIGTKIATKVLKDGDLIEVDANNAMIKKL